MGDTPGFRSGHGLPDPLDRMYEAMFGGPEVRGIVWAVDQLTNKTIPRLAETVEKHGRTLYGNGDKGLVAQVDRQTEFMEDVKGNQRWLLRFVVAELLAIVGAGLTLILRGVGG